MMRDNDLENKVSKMLKGKTILTAVISSYDGLIEIDKLIFVDGTSIKFGMTLEDGVSNEQRRLAASTGSHRLAKNSHLHR